MNAPTVVALGVDETALRIREVADGNKVAIVSAPPLARALYREGQLGKETRETVFGRRPGPVLRPLPALRAWRTGPMPDAPHIQVDEFGKEACERPALHRLQHPPRPGNDPPGSWRAVDRAGPAGHGRGAAGAPVSMFTNIAISLMVLLAVVYVKRPLDFTIFPDRAVDHHHASAGAERGLHPRDPAQWPERARCRGARSSPPR